MKIIIFGAGGQAKETIDLIKENTDGEILGFLNKQSFSANKDSNPREIFGYPNLGTDKDLNKIIKKYQVTHFFVAIGDLAIRSKIYLSTKKILKPLSIISRKANISKYAKLGDHVIVYPGVTINADVVIGNDVYINSNASIGHEVKIGDHVNINPGANIAGKVIIDDFCFIGIGASIRENLHIAKNTTIGGGAMMAKNTEPNKTYVGVPAEIISKNEKD